MARRGFTSDFGQPSFLSDPDLLNAMKDCTQRLERLNKCLASIGEDELSIVPNIAFPIRPEDVNNYSANLAEMQTQTDPYPAGVPSLPEYMTGELERIRYQLNEIIGGNFWYEDVPASLAGLSALLDAHGGRHGAGQPDALQVNAINTGMLQSSVVTAVKVADAAITTPKILDQAITSAKILDGTIVNTDIGAAAAIAWSKIAVSGNVVYKNVAEEITGGWTFKTGDTRFDSVTRFYNTAVVRENKHLRFLDTDEWNRMEMWADLGLTTFRMETQTAGTDILIKAHDDITITVGDVFFLKGWGGAQNIISGGGLDTTISADFTNAPFGNVQVWTRAGGDKAFQPVINNNTNLGTAALKWKSLHTFDIWVDHLPYFDPEIARRTLEQLKTEFDEERGYDKIIPASLPTFLRDKHGNVFLEGVLGILMSAVKDLLKTRIVGE